MVLAVQKMVTVWEYLLYRQKNINDIFKKNILTDIKFTAAEQFWGILDSVRLF